ncbi:MULTISPECIES: O-antigen polymerase [unclassified Sporosarcina]|uniref:O-antigen polymerase n=1 Tax=unclassified Sporosarcina TaxID=2647733 RepID=UPI000C165EAD|nr:MULTISPECIES: O-antigen polymerase [unclassified Sporosarcina]PID05895.1 hypothetical protein CSV66_07855 [Sporosarcina sp. P30]PID09089.1 hypothetical protein CSV65_07855 [Sporosarcina sp. P31]PID12386.1 hypothetical protein CSV64_07325 [Sporosarcina sp. P32b]
MNLIIVVYYIISILFILVHYTRYHITPALIFVSMQIVMFTGIIMSQALYPLYYVEKLSVMYLLSLVFFVSGIMVVGLIRSNKRIENSVVMEIPSIKYESYSSYQLKVIITLVSISTIVCSIFFFNAGINIFIESIKTFISGGNQVFTSQRKDFTEVRGVGYVYQFRTIILPLLNIFLLVGQKNKNVKVLGVVIIPFTVSFLLGTGQRNAFVFFLLFIFIYLILQKKHFKTGISKLKLTLLFIVSTIILSILTITNGRISSSSGNELTLSLLSILDRIFGVNSRAGLNGMMYIDSQQTVWGYDWLIMLVNILPFKVEYTSVASIVYNSLYGTYRGTEPPDIWSSAFYNWSWFGVIVFPFILGIIYHSIYFWFRNKTKTPLIIFIYAGLCTYLGLWISDGPIFLFNNGVITILIMYFLLHFKMAGINVKGKHL